MRFSLTIICFCIFNPLFSQKLKNVVEEDYQIFCRNEFTVLKKNKTLKHGNYKSIYVNGNPRLEGYYKFGLKDSLWIFFNPNKPIISSRGYFKDDKKVGVWQYYDDKEQAVNIYNHSTSVLSYTTYIDTNKTHTVRLNNSLITTQVNRPAFYLLGEKNKMRIVRENIVYPKEAIKSNIYGTVIISFFITKYGEAVDYKITKGIGGGCDKEALRVVKLLPNEWVPCIYNNELVETQVSIFITFQLN